MNTPQIDLNMFAQIRNFCLTVEQSAKEAGVLLALGKEDEAKAFIDRGARAYTTLACGAWYAAIKLWLFEIIIKTIS